MISDDRSQLFLFISHFFIFFVFLLVFPTLVKQNGTDHFRPEMISRDRPEPVLIIKHLKND